MHSLTLEATVLKLNSNVRPHFYKDMNIFGKVQKEANKLIIKLINCLFSDTE